MRRRVRMPDGTTVYLSARQAAWMGKHKPLVATCDGCTLFGACILHTSDWSNATA